MNTSHDISGFGAGRKTPVRTPVPALRALCLLCSFLIPVSGNAAETDDDSSTAETPPASAAAPTPAPGKTKIYREDLITNSPFRQMTPGLLRPGQIAAAQPLEIHGFLGHGENLEVSLTNPVTRECLWVRVRDRSAKWYVESADPVARTAVVVVDRVPVTLVVRASERSLPIESPVERSLSAPPRPVGPGVARFPGAPLPSGAAGAPAAPVAPAAPAAPLPGRAAYPGAAAAPDAQQQRIDRANRRAAPAATPAARPAAAPASRPAATPAARPVR
ncbi:MAG: hypothetical protein LBV54_05920 [Puniceicoccales bacterium]|nr:hypothetical protein [Puniceicoccales bacterium]